MRSRAAALVVALCATSCGATTAGEPQAAAGRSEEPSQASPDATAAPAKGSSDAAREDGATVPKDCKQSGELCLPPAAFTKRLCSGMNPDVALAFFRKGTPFSRAYMKMNVDAWNASGGASSADKLVFDEEVIILLARKNETGIQVSGASGGYDVLRWDGTCATLSAEEVTLNVPPKPKNAKVLWKDFSEQTQNALLGDPNIAKLNKERRDECKGASIGEVSKKCVTLVDKLSEAIVSYVRNGGEVAPPAKLK